MEQQIYKGKLTQFHRLKIAKKEELTKNTFSLEFGIPENLKENFRFDAGQFVSIRFQAHGKEIINDYSMTSAPYEHKIALGIKMNSPEGAASQLFQNYQEGDELLVSEPGGRFTLISKPSEFRTIVGFAAGIGITPILSHFKNILHNEPRTRLFLFLEIKALKISFTKMNWIASLKCTETGCRFFIFSPERKPPTVFFMGDWMIKN